MTRNTTVLINWKIVIEPDTIDGKELSEDDNDVLLTTISEQIVKSKEFNGMVQI